jgi:hypothetical protein
VRLQRSAAYRVRLSLVALASVPSHDARSLGEKFTPSAAPVPPPLISGRGASLAAVRSVEQNTSNTHKRSRSMGASLAA